MSRQQASPSEGPGGGRHTFLFLRMASPPCELAESVSVPLECFTEGTRGEIESALLLYGEDITARAVPVATGGTDSCGHASGGGVLLTLAVGARRADVLVPSGYPSVDALFAREGGVGGGAPPAAGGGLLEILEHYDRAFREEEACSTAPTALPRPCAAAGAAGAPSHPVDHRQQHLAPPPPPPLPPLPAVAAAAATSALRADTLPDELRVVVIELAHVRDARRYTRTLARLVAAARVDSVCMVLPASFGRVVCAAIGAPLTVRALLWTWKASSIDVDARGRPCKERLLSVLHERTVCRDARAVPPRGLHVVQQAAGSDRGSDDELRHTVGAWLEGW